MHTVKIRSVMVAGTVRGFFLGFVRKKARASGQTATKQKSNFDDVVQHNSWLDVRVGLATTSLVRDVLHVGECVAAT